MKSMEIAPTSTTPPAAKPAVAGSHATPPTSSGRTLLLMLAGFVVLLIILAGFTIFSRSRARAQLVSDTLANELTTVSVVHPKRVPVEIKLELPGDITAFEETPIYARVSGYLKQWFTDIGTHVVAGQALAEIETPELDQELIQANAALAQAKASLEIARISAERWQNLRKSDSVSQQDTDVKVASRMRRWAGR